MKPTFEEFLRGSTTWTETHDGLSILISFHSVREATKDIPAHPGTWNYYLFVPEEMYPHRWDDFACKRVGDYERPGAGWDEIYFHNGITYSRSKPYYSRKTKRVWDQSKVGCDYAHLWDEERGYPDTFDSVRANAIATAKDFLDQHPDFNRRCRYCGLWDKAENFYEANNDAFVHKSQLSVIEPSMIGWLPKEAA